MKQVFQWTVIFLFITALGIIIYKARQLRGE